MDESARTLASRPIDRGRLAGLFAAYAIAAILVLAPARTGDFVSDDLPNVVYNPYVHALTPANLLALLDPAGEPAANTFNYAPVHMLVLAVEWQLFGDDVRGYHVVNALAHAAVAALLAALLAARGLPLAAAGLGGAFFLLHPANVEAAAWIFQIKTTGATALALGALLLHPRRPALALVLFGLALLTKASAAFALPMALAFTAQDRQRADGWRARAGWLVGWIALLAPYAWLELGVLGRMEESHAPLHPDPWVHARSVVALAGRYLWMALTSYGVAPSHDPAPAVSWLDPWWIAGIAVPTALAARTLWAWRAHREEAAWWIGAAAGYLPVAQIGMTFLQPMADRYLYCALPGLIGGCAFALRDACKGRAISATTRRAAMAGSALLLVVIALFALRSHAQAQHWRSAVTLALASAARYPAGLPAQLLEAQRAALRGDAPGSVRALRAAVARGYDRFETLADAPVYDAVRRDPGFQELLREMASSWVEQSLTLEHVTQADLVARANAYAVLGESARAVAALDEALRIGGPLDARVRAERLRHSRHER